MGLVKCVKKLGLIISFLLGFPSSLLATDYERTITNKIEIQNDGTAVITRVERVPASRLAEVYIAHHKYLSTDKKVEDNFFDELSKEIYFLYGSTPVRKSFKTSFDIDEKGNFASTVTMKVPGFVREENKVLVVSRKRIVDDGVKLSPKLYSKYFEHEIDGRLFQSAFLQSEKDSLVTQVETEIVLPQGSRDIEKPKPIFDDGSATDWYVDFGGGSVSKGGLTTKGNSLVIEERFVTRGSAPSRLLDQKQNEDVLDALRNYGAFEVAFKNDTMKGLTKPEPHPVKDDYSGSWSYSVSSGERLSKTFTYQTLTMTPGITVTLGFNVSLLWEHQLTWSGFRCRYQFKKFETTLSVSPSLTPYVEVQSGASLSKQWSATVFERGTTATFWFWGVPVVLYLNAKLVAEAEANLSGSIGFRIEGTYGVTTSITVRYQGGWSKSVNVTPNYQSPSFTASAKMNANAEGRLPFTLGAYVYNVAGPFVTLTPWIRGETNASVGSSNQVGYEVKGGIKADGGVQMSGWLQSLCGSIPSVSCEFFSREWTLKSGTYTF